MKTIEIDNLILVEVPKDVTNFEVFAKKDNVDYEIIGLIETPDLNFYFEVDENWVESIKQFSSVFITGHSIMYKDYMIINKNNEFCLLMKEDSFRTRIQKAIQDIEIKGNLLLIKKLK